MPAFHLLGPGGLAASRSLALSLREARPSVQVMVLLRLTAGAALTAPVSQWTLPGLLVVGFAWLATSHAVYLLNGMTDVTEDRANGSRRPIAAGALPARHARWTFVTLVSAAFVVAIPGGTAMVLFVALGLTLGWMYSVPRKDSRYRAAWSAGLVIVFGVLTYSAGRLTVPTAARGGLTELLVFAGGLSAWLVVGAMAKDLSDVTGDRLAGRRSWPLLLGDRTYRKTLAGLSLTVGFAFFVACVLAEPSLAVISAIVIGGALIITVTVTSSRYSGRPRLPYRVFMVTQYAAHATVLVRTTA